MAKFGFIIILISGVIFFNSCSRKSELPTAEAPVRNAREEQQLSKAYGAYIAGRVAHLRNNFNKAADYYIETLQSDPDNPELVSRVYLLLASEGRIDEAAKYARISRQNGDNNNFINIILSVNDMKHGRYEEAGKAINSVNNPIYKNFINPLMTAWIYAGAGEADNALNALEPLKKEPGFKALYIFQAGMINDYFGRNAEAERLYDRIVTDESTEMSFRSLQIITNFYLRNNQKEKAVRLVKKYNDEKLLADMLEKLADNVQNADPAATQPILTDANIGMAEALFRIAGTLRQGAAGIDLAHMFISMSIYSNPKYDLAKLLLADILENREMYAEANQVYDEIDKDSETYYTVQLKKANNYVMMEDYIPAEILLKSMAAENPRSYQLFLDLGDLLRMRNKQDEAIKYYLQAIKKIPRLENQHWILFYALGVSYEQNEDWKKAENSFKEAMKLSGNHYLVLNYLGYSWLKQGRNTEQAFGMIVDAYNQAPNDGHISDSLGWAFYQLGMYDQAIAYLEKAAEIEPANAVISDHLGDAYWFGGRKNEARFQWKHALTMKDDSGELSVKNVKNKIKNGLNEPRILSFNQATVDEKIKEITAE